MGDWSQAAFSMPETVQSVVRCQDNGPLLAAAATLWIRPGDVVLDATYGRGRFWTCIRPEHLIAHDLVLDGVDFRHLPEADNSVDVLVLDPPYITMGGNDTSTVPDFCDRYGIGINGPQNPAELAQLMADGIAEAARVLRPKGRLFVKCMDYVKGGRLVLGRHSVVTTALAHGLEQVDEFVHFSGTGPQPMENLDGSPRTQQHSRRAHSFLCIFQKPRGQAQYLPPPAATNPIPTHFDGLGPGETMDP